MKSKCGTYFTDENYIFKFINHVLHYAEVKEGECNWHPAILRKHSSDKEISLVKDIIKEVNN
tara:strand:+ start:615 stop:800 length:186 start_codon:yes stop_codon:yes gene_type:complete